MNIAIAVLISLAFAALLLLQWRSAELSRRSEEGRARLLGELTRRFENSDEFLAFAESREGRLLFGVRDIASQTARLLLLMAQAGILLAALGSAFFVTVATTPNGADINLIREAEQAQYWGTMCVALGVGFGIACWVGQKLARSWGLLPSD
jgi:hypothetical protein